MSSLGKEGRARQARLAVAVNGKVTPAAAGRSSHRAAGGAPRVVDPTHKAVVEYLETLEQRSVATSPCSDFAVDCSHCASFQRSKPQILERGHSESFHKSVRGVHAFAKNPAPVKP